MTHRFLMAAGLALGLAAAAVPARAPAETLADALAYGYENSGLLEQNRALLRAADEDVAQAASTLLPVINWSAQAQSALDTDLPGDLVQGSLQISADLTLYDGGQNRLAIEAQKQNVLATREELRQIEQQVLLRIVQAYLEIRRASEFVQLRQNNLRLIGEELRAAQDRFEVGEVTRTDVSLAEARLAGARSELAAEQGGLAQAVEEFRAAVGRAPGDLAPVGPVTIQQSLEEAIRIAQRLHPDILSAQFSVVAAETNISRARAAQRPSVSLGAQVGLDQDLETSRGLSLSVGGPIYQGGRISSTIRQAMANRDAARAQLLVSTRAVIQNVGNAYTAIEVSRARSVASRGQVRAAEVAFEGIREEATLGARTTLDVLDAEQELLDARATLISAQIDEALASYQVLQSMGLLTAEALQLRVQIYDPSAYYNLVREAPTSTSEQGQALDRVLQALGRN